MTCFVLATPPIIPAPSCYIQPTSGEFQILLQWSLYFNSQHSVERYDVRVMPDTRSCSREAPHNETYRCLLNPRVNISIVASAVNCGNQKGRGEVLFFNSPSFSKSEEYNNCWILLARRQIASYVYQKLFVKSLSVVNTNHETVIFPHALFHIHFFHMHFSINYMANMYFSLCLIQSTPLLKQSLVLC